MDQSFQSFVGGKEGERKYCLDIKNSLSYRDFGSLGPVIFAFDTSTYDSTKFADLVVGVLYRNVHTFGQAWVGVWTASPESNEWKYISHEMGVTKTIPVSNC